MSPHVPDKVLAFPGREGAVMVSAEVNRSPALLDLEALVLWLRQPCGGGDENLVRLGLHSVLLLFGWLLNHGFGLRRRFDCGGMRQVHVRAKELVSQEGDDDLVCVDVVAGCVWRVTDHRVAANLQNQRQSHITDNQPLNSSLLRYFFHDMKRKNCTMYTSRWPRRMGVVACRTTELRVPS